jgi:hypothetical protein
VVKVPRDGQKHTNLVKKDGFLTAQRAGEGKDDQALKVRLSPKPVEEKEEPLPPPPPPAPPAPKPVQVAQKPAPSPPEPQKSEPPKAQTPKKHHARPKKEDTLILTPSF